MADAREALTAIAAGLAAAGHDGTSQEYRQRVSALKAEWDERVTFHRTPSGETGDLAQPEVIGILNDAVGGHATVVCAAGSLPGDLLKLWRPEDSKAYHLEYGYSCMGYEIPAGIGVKLAEPEREVVVAIGDGTYLMLNSEIVTAVAEGIKLTIVVFDNHGYQCIKDLAWACGVPQFGNELRFREAGTGRLTGGYIPVDFKKHARVDGGAGHLRPHRGRHPAGDRDGARPRWRHRHPRGRQPGQARAGLRLAGGTCRSRPCRGPRP